jgi:TPR repeat protein
MRRGKVFALAGVSFVLLSLGAVYAAPREIIRVLHFARLPAPQGLRRLESERVLAALKTQASNGDCQSQYELALRLHERQFPNRVYTAMQGESRAWLLRSAKGGCLDAMTELGRYADDAGDFQEALRWYSQAAELGDGYSEWKMGGYYTEGRGVGRDLGKALQWYGRAQNSGFDAEREIADTYDEEGNLLEAHLWYDRALAAGDGFTAQTLGQCYKAGGNCKGLCDSRKPCPRDLYRAYLWLRVADLYGKCCDCYRQIAPLLLPEQAQRAESEALAWAKAHPSSDDNSASNRSGTDHAYFHLD